MDKIDFSLVKIPLLLLFISILFLVLSTLGINYFTDNENKILQELTQSIRISTEKLQKRINATKLYEEWLEDYPMLSRFSFQQADKLHWLENIQEQAEILGLPSITYNIKARTPDVHFGNELKGQSVVYSTGVQIRAGLVHEEQLIHFFGQLKQAGLGNFSVEQCNLGMNGQEKRIQPGSANVTAQCLINWYTVDKKKDGGLALGTGGLI